MGCRIPPGLKTSRTRRRNRRWPPPPRPKTLAPTPPVAGFPIEHAPQRLAAQAATETLRRPVRRHVKALVAARPLTGPRREILRNCCWALALARRRRRRSRRSRLERRGRRRRRLGQNDQRQPSPITPALLPPANLACRAGPPGPAGLPTSPTPRCGAAGVRAVPALRMGGPIGTLAALEQATPATQERGRGRRILSRCAANGILRGTQGSWRSQRPSLGGERLLPPRRFHLDTTTLQRNGRRRETPGREPKHGGETRIGIGKRNDGPMPWPMSTNIGLAGHWPMKWTTS